MKLRLSVAVQPTLTTSISGCEMSGFAKGGVAIPSGSNLAIAGNKPSGVAAQGQVIWVASAWQLLASVQAISPTTTTDPIDTTGANLLVYIGIAGQVGTTSFTDSNNNSWTLGVGVEQSGPNQRSEIYYCLNPVVGTNHSFTFTGSRISNSFIILAFKGPSALTVDNNSGTTNNQGTPTSFTLTSLTPSAPNSLIVSGVLHASSGVTTISSGFAIVKQQSFVNGGNFGGAAAYLIQGAAASIAPTWTVSSAPYASGWDGTMLSFRP